MRVLFTGAGGAGTEALWTLLHDRHELHFADAVARRVNPIVASNRVHEIPMAASEHFTDFMKGLCRDLQIDVLVPGVDEELEQLALRRLEFGPTEILTPTAAFTKTMLDKFEFARALGEVGVPVPLTRRLLDPEPWTTFPCIVKPVRGRGSRGVKFVADENAFEALRLEAGEGAPKCIVQEFVSGTEYSVQVVADRKGQLRAVFPARIVAKRGITISAVGEENPAVIDACRHLHRFVPTSGCYNVQGILGDDLIFLPFEINPRVSTTLCLAVASGIDPVDIYTMRPESQGLVRFEAGVALDRFWHNAFTRPSSE